MERRSLLKLGALLPMVSIPVHAQVREIRMLESGGASGDSVEAAYIKPFTERSGVRVTRESPTSLGKVTAMVQSGNVNAVLVELSATSLAMARAQGLLEPLDWAAINPVNEVYPEARQPDAIGFQYYSTILAWEKGAKPMSSWADFWNLKDFPGRRALPDYPSFAIPIALLADGVKAENLYPLDLDRAFASLRRMKEHITVWWTSGAQAPQLLQDREVRYSAVWSGRVVGDTKVDYTYNNGLLMVSYFAVPKGADPAQKAVAMRLLREMTDVRNQAAAARLFPVGGAGPGVDKLLTAARAAELPTSEANRRVQGLNNPLADPTMTPDKVRLIERRWQEFKLGR